MTVKKFISWANTPLPTYEYDPTEAKNQPITSKEALAAFVVGLALLVAILVAFPLSEICSERGVTCSNMQNKK